MFFIAGLILLTCGPWFADQHTVGLILIIPGAIEILFYVVVLIGFIVAAIKD